MVQMNVFQHAKCCLLHVYSTAGKVILHLIQNMVAICEITILILHQVHSRSVTINGFVCASNTFVIFLFLLDVSNLSFELLHISQYPDFHNLNYHTHNKILSQNNEFLCKFFSTSSQVVFHSDTITFI
jgi:hypothetical protein